VSLVVYMLLAAILTFGQALYCAQTIQQAVDVAARELSRTPLPPAATDSQHPYDLNYVLYGDANSDPALASVRRQVFDDNLLVLTVDPTPSNGNMTFNGGHPIGDFPLVTQQLLPVMVYDTVNGQSLLHYPGALFQSGQQSNTSPAGIAASGYVVRIPVLSVSTSGTVGTESIVNWVPPLEPILDTNGANAFAVNAVTVSGQSGAVALRINYPYQSASMNGFQPGADPSQPGGASVVPISASGGGSPPAPTGVGGPVTSDQQFGPYAGANGLGQQAAWAQTVRPFRRLISAQAIYRREVFQ
jgi:Flp pilus assembly protein TadG